MRRENHAAPSLSDAQHDGSDVRTAWTETMADRSDYIAPHSAK